MNPERKWAFCDWPELAAHQPYRTIQQEQKNVKRGDSNRKAVGKEINNEGGYAGVNGERWKGHPLKKNDAVVAMEAVCV